MTMERTISFKINCGDTTCVDPETLKPCEHLGSRRMGTVPVCLRFQDKLNGYLPMELDLTPDVPPEKQWRLRCRECLESEVKPGVDQANEK